jgi:hypothetical protein
VTDRRNRELVLARLGELPNAYEALEHQVARSSAGRLPSGGEPPIPVRAAVMDLMADIEASVLRLHSRALVLLGWYLPPVRLARDGQWLPCPECGTNALLIDRQAWAIFCGFPGCKGRWSWGHEVELLGQILAAQGHEGDLVKTCALKVAQEVANDLGADAGEPAADLDQSA